MSLTTNDNITLTARCLCSAHKFKATISRSSLPLHGHICHCTSCRHINGGLYSSATTWPEPRANVDVSALKPFPFSPNVDLLFCPTCSSPVFCAWSRDETQPLWVVTGALDHTKEDLLKFGDHGFVADTSDGGASVWLRHPNRDGLTCKRFQGPSYGDEAKELSDDWPPANQITSYDERKYDSVPIRCRCAGVGLTLHRGDYSSMNQEALPWNVDPTTHKLLADFCGCDSCRLQSGLDVFTWAFAEMKQVSFSKDPSTPFPNHMADLNELIDAHDPAIGTLRYYKSSPEVSRYFCGNCSACIFYANGKRPTFVDIAVGVLEAPDGARAEGMLSWAYGVDVSFREDGDGGWREGLFSRVEKDAEEYRVARGYPRNWHRLKKDENKENNVN